MTDKSRPPANGDAAAPAAKPSVPAFLQTPLGMFLLSSVLLPALIAMHGYLADRWAQARKLEDASLARIARIEKIDTEIAFRYSKAMLYLEMAETGADPGAGREKVLQNAIFQLTANPRNAASQSLYPEFENSSAYALLSELREQLISSGIRSERRTQPGSVQYVILKLSTLEDDVRSDKITASVATQRLKAAMYLPPVERTEKVLWSRWRKGFARTDCENEKLFC